MNRHAPALAALTVLAHLVACSTPSQQEDGGSTGGGSTGGGSAGGGSTGGGSTGGGSTGGGSTGGGSAGGGSAGGGLTDSGFAPTIASCGNNLCEAGETHACADCPADAGTCGDGTCNFGESTNNCLADCRPLLAGGNATLALPDLGTGRYKNYQGGLYPGGANVPPADHLAAGQAALSTLRPLAIDGGVDLDGGSIVMVSVGMSNTTQEFCHNNGIENFLAANCQNWSFSGRARDDAAVNHTSLVIVNGARGGMSVENWVSPPVAHSVPSNSTCSVNSQPGNASLYPNTAVGNAEKANVFGPDLQYNEEWDRIAACQLKAKGYSARQVQVAWVKLSRADNMANQLPDPNADAYNLERDLGNVMRTMKNRFPNLKMVFLSSRVWGGFSGSTTAEPYAFETGFAVKWLIEAQINQVRNSGTPTVPSNAPGYPGDLDYRTGVAPLLFWGPYVWANYNRPTTESAEWFGDVGSDLYAGLLSNEAGNSLSLPAANAGTYYAYCGAGTGSPAAATPGPQQGARSGRWCDSDYFTLLGNGQRANNGGTATYGWASDFMQEDGTHPTHDGEAKVGTLLLHFFKNSPLTHCWFLANQSCP